MHHPATTCSGSERPHRRRQLAHALAAALAGLVLAVSAGLALAQSYTLGVAKNVLVAGKTRETVVVNSKGIAVYLLGGETPTHPLCSNLVCFTFWPPVKVPSANTQLTAAPGVRGRLGVWHRDGFYQVTLAGHPLYTYAGDPNKPGVANGENVMSFGGTWHVIAAHLPRKKPRR